LISSWLLPIHSAEIYFISGAFAGILDAETAPEIK